MRELELSCLSEATLRTTLLWGTYRLFPLSAVVQCYVEGWPFIDTWGPLSAIADWVAKQRGKDSSP